MIKRLAEQLSQVEPILRLRPYFDPRPHKSDTDFEREYREAVARNPKEIRRVE